jgi:hypothetical protein
MMPPPQDEDPHGRGSFLPPNYAPDDDRISRAAQTLPFSDLRDSLQSMYQYAMLGVHLTSKQRFWAGKNFVRQGIEFLSTKFPDEAESQKTLTDLLEKWRAITPPHPTYSAGKSEQMRVVTVKNSRADSATDSPPENLTPGLVSEMIERDYAEVLDAVLDLVSIVASLLESRGLLHYKEEEDDDDEEYDLDGDLDEEEEDPDAV